jgi:acyl-CoA dehydrogenase
VQDVCERLDDWEISRARRPDEIWQIFRRERFFGLIIPERYGGAASRLARTPRWW